jgi:hypothetical protein
MQAHFIGKAKVASMIALTLFTTLYGCKKEFKGEQPNNQYDFDVALFGGADGKFAAGSGIIKFRQDSDTGQIATLDTYVLDLLPNHSYQLQRAVNPIADTTGCSSTAWLTLGLGSVPQAIHTNSIGAAHITLWRNLAAVAAGTSFHIHFQVVDSGTTSTVLSSDCHNFTVK